MAHVMVCTQSGSSYWCNCCHLQPYGLGVLEVALIVG